MPIPPSPPQSCHKACVPHDGNLTLRFDGTTLVAEALSGAPISLEYGFTDGAGNSLSFLLPRVFLPKPKYKIPGPGGVEAAFDWQAAFDETSGAMLTVTLTNDIVGYPS
ncbi:MAG: phage tail tube protein [Alphaproteobacteria bacterium]